MSSLRVRDIPTSYDAAVELLVHTKNKQRRIGKNGWLYSVYNPTTKMASICLKLYDTVIVRWWIQWDMNNVGIKVIDEGIELNNSYDSNTSKRWIKLSQRT